MVAHQRSTLNILKEDMEKLDLLCRIYDMKQYSLFRFLMDYFIKKEGLNLDRSIEELVSTKQTLKSFLRAFDKQ